MPAAANFILWWPVLGQSRLLFYATSVELNHLSGEILGVSCAKHRSNEREPMHSRRPSTEIPSFAE